LFANKIFIPLKQELFLSSPKPSHFRLQPVLQYYHRYEARYLSNIYRPCWCYHQQAHEFIALLIKLYPNNLASSGLSAYITRGIVHAGFPAIRVLWWLFRSTTLHL